VATISLVQDLLASVVPVVQFNQMCGWPRGKPMASVRDTPDDEAGMRIPFTNHWHADSRANVSCAFTASVVRGLRSAQRLIQAGP